MKFKKYATIICFLFFAFVLSANALAAGGYSDVSASHWALSDIQWVSDQGLMVGIDENRFDPSGKATRSMFVAVLWRMEGCPVPGGRTPFTDITQGWYYDAVVWSYNNNIVSGTSATTFSPNMTVTREQAAALLYRYAEYKGISMTAFSDLNTFPDYSNCSSWARNSLSWANAEGIISGTGDGKLLPKGNATRDQLASILHRFANYDVRMKNHTHSFSSQTIGATCSSKGYTLKKCNCGITFKTDVVKVGPHNYKYFKCTECGDIENAYGYLGMWIVFNGTESETMVSYYDEFGYNCLVLSTTNEGEVIVALFMDVEDTYDLQDDIYAAVYLNDFSYYCNGEWAGIPAYVIGELNPDTLRENSRILPDVYNGPTSIKNDFIQLSESGVHSILQILEMFLEYNNLGITLEDLGFLVY